MVKISIMYPNTKDGHFDVDYYVKTHMPMSIDHLSKHPGFRGVTVERGISGTTPDSEPSYVSMCHYVFNSIEDFWAACTPAIGQKMQDDMLKCTNIEPVVQFNEILISK